MATASGSWSFQSLRTACLRPSSLALLTAASLAAPLGAQQAPPPPQPPPPETPAANPPPSEEPASNAAFMTLIGATDPNAAPQAAPVQDEKPAAQKKGLQWTVGDYVWKFGGYIKVDLIHDFNDIGNTDAFDVRTIPTTGAASDGSNTSIHARQTRFNMDVRGPSDIDGDFHAFVEGDFFGDGNAFRMRHAYGEMGHLLAGQTWSTFLDEDAMPETLDFESPVAFPSIRQAQFRYTQRGEDGDYWAVALEDPQSDLQPPIGVPGDVKEPYPDLTARMHWENKLGHVHAGAFLGAARFLPDNGVHEDAVLWGFNLATLMRTVGEDNTILQLTYGDGVGRYRGGLTAGPDANGNLEAIPVLALMASYQHFWSPKYRSSIGYAWADADLPSGMLATANETATYGFVNLIWQFSYRAWTGVEFLHGTLETFDGADGDANRLQFSVRFDI